MNLQQSFGTKAFLLLFCCFTAITSAFAQQKLNWQPRQDLNILLPPSVQVYEAYGKLADGAPIHAMYTLIDLTDENLKFRVVGDNKTRYSTKEFVQQQKAILGINGGYYAANGSTSLMVQDGRVLAQPPAPAAKGAFGIVNGKPDVTWNYNFSGLAYSFPDPSPAAAKQQTVAQLWPASQAIGGGPVLLENGKIKVTSKQEGFGGSHLWRHPRTAAGYLDSTTVIWMVVDGRQQGSAGVTLEELAQIFYDLGTQEAVNLDGGGSSQMIALDEVVNLPEGNRNVLRRNASAMVLLQENTSAPRQVFIYDTESHSYYERGLWQSSNLPNFYGSTTARVASISDEPASVKYQFDSLADGHYQVAAWWPAHQNLSEKVSYVLHHGTRHDTITVNQASFEGLGKWNVLGNFNLSKGDYLELLVQGQGKQVAADAIRLVHQGPTRGDVRLAVISDLNSSYGDTTYEAQVGETLRRLPSLWKPDMVIAGGDLVAGQSRQLTDARLKAMWAGFDRTIFQPLRKAQIPFAFTIGNHDGSGGGGFERERAVTQNFWKNPKNHPGLQLVDSTHFPFYYSFEQNGLFFVSWDASDASISDQELEWVRQAFTSPAAKKAPMRVLVGHLPLYGVAQERDSPGNVLRQPEKLQALLEELGVRMYISGHHHAFYPGKRGQVELLNAGALGSGPRKWLTTPATSPHTITLVDYFSEKDSIAYTTFDVGNIVQNQLPEFDEKILPPLIYGENGFIRRRDVAPTSLASGKLSATHLGTGAPATPGEGEVSAKLQNGQLKLEAFWSFFLKNKAKTDLRLSLYQGRHGAEGTHVATFTPHKTSRKKIEFEATLPGKFGFDELLGAGGFYVILHSPDSSKTFARAQLYPVSNTAPVAPAFLSHQPRHVYAIRKTEALFPITWAPATDPDQDPVTYTYQVSATPDFKSVAWNYSTGKATSVKVKEEAWRQFLAGVAPGEVKTIYHRLVVSDGKNISAGPAVALQLTTSNQSVTGPVEVEAPNWVAKGTLGPNVVAPHGITTSGNGNIWIASYTTGIHVRKPDGSPFPLTSKALVLAPDNTGHIKAIRLEEGEIQAVSLRGISQDADGHVLVIVNNNYLIKLHQETGEPLAYWKGPTTIGQATAAADGTVVATTVTTEGHSTILQQTGKTYKATPITLLSGRPLARTSQISADGKTLYIPSATDPGIWVFNRSQTGFTPGERLTNTAAGSNAIARHANGSIWLVVKSDGFGAAQLQMVDPEKGRYWALPLPALAKEGGFDEARGLTFSPDGKTLYIAGYDTGKIYVYQLQE
ncbi:phosphodiester glycosidase family protein [Rufibacter roseus]